MYVCVRVPHSGYSEHLTPTPPNLRRFYAAPYRPPSPPDLYTPSPLGISIINARRFVHQPPNITPRARYFRSALSLCHTNTASYPTLCARLCVHEMSVLWWVFSLRQIHIHKVYYVHAMATETHTRTHFSGDCGALTADQTTHNTPNAPVEIVLLLSFGRTFVYLAVYGRMSVCDERQECSQANTQRTHRLCCVQD